MHRPTNEDWDRACEKSRDEAEALRQMHELAELQDELDATEDDD